MKKLKIIMLSVLICGLLLFIVLPKGRVDVSAVETDGCILFSSESEIKLKSYNQSITWDGTLEYSTDGSTWNIWDGTEIIGTSGKIYLRGTGNTYITGNSSKGFTMTGNNVLCYGNIENLLDYTQVGNNIHPTMAKKLFCRNV